MTALHQVRLVTGSRRRDMLALAGRVLSDASGSTGWSTRRSAGVGSGHLARQAGPAQPHRQDRHSHSGLQPAAYRLAVDVIDEMVMDPPSPNST